MKNRLKTAFLVTVLTSLAVGAGYLADGAGGMVLAFAVALAASSIAYWFSDRLALAMAGAREVSEAEAPALHRILGEQRGRAFERFARTDSARARDGDGGAGLGLAFARVQGGELRLVEMPGWGAVLRLWLPDASPDGGR